MQRQGLVCRFIVVRVVTYVGMVWTPFVRPLLTGTVCQAPHRAPHS